MPYNWRPLSWSATGYILRKARSGVGLSSIGRNVDGMVRFGVIALSPAVCCEMDARRRAIVGDLENVGELDGGGSNAVVEDGARFDEEGFGGLCSWKRENWTRLSSVMNS